MSFFEKMDAIQAGFYRLCRYSGVRVNGAYIRSSDTPYEGISTRNYADIIPCFQFGVESVNTTPSRPLLLTNLYPFFGDSIGFPSQIGAIAKKLEPSAAYVWDDYTHYIIHVTFNGQTNKYGGEGHGTGKDISSDMILHRYTFDGTPEDAFGRNSWKELDTMLGEYSRFSDEETEPDPSQLTMDRIKATIGDGKNYARVRLIGGAVTGGSRYGFACLYKNNDGSLTYYFSDDWYDGRYYNHFEVFEKGTKFEDAPEADIILEDVKIMLPETIGGREYLYDGRKIREIPEYNADTGIWKGLMRYAYDKKSGTWISDICKSFGYKTDDDKFHRVEDPEFLSLFTLTKDDVKSLAVDRNADQDPENYYCYDGTVPPGTKYKP